MRYVAEYSCSLKVKIHRILKSNAVLSQGEIADERTAYFFGDLLWHVSGTTYFNYKYICLKNSPDYEVGIYDILFAFIDNVRNKTVLLRIASKSVLAVEILKKNKRATYRNFKWKNLYEKWYVMENEM